MIAIIATIWANPQSTGRLKMCPLASNFNETVGDLFVGWFQIDGGLKREGPKIRTIVHVSLEPLSPASLASKGEPMIC